MWRRRSGFWILALLLSGGTGWAAVAVPVAVSPGNAGGLPVLVESCPPFFWTAVEGARLYELVIYRVVDSVPASSSPFLRVEVPGGATGWAPTREQCLKAGGRYAWALRVVTHDDEVGAWSEAILLEVSMAPSEAEVAEALSVLRRYQDNVTRGAAGQHAGVDAWTPLYSGSLGAREPLPGAIIGPTDPSLSIAGDLQMGGHVFKDGYAFLHNVGGSGAGNTGLGLAALASVTVGSGMSYDGKENTAVGESALLKTSAGYANTATGASALRFNTTGHNNIAVGYRAGYFLGNVYPGPATTTMSDNIFIGSLGESDEEATIRIGTPGVHARTFLAGVLSNYILLTSPNVHIDSQGQLGVVASSERFKEDIQSMADASSRLFDLRPVRFRFKAETPAGEKPWRYGLIAEEVETVFPELVIQDKEGRPFSVNYEDLAPLLLNELQKLHRTVARQDARLAAQRAELTRLTREAEREP